MHPSPTRAQVYQMNDPCYHIGGGVPQIDLKIKNLMCGISRSPTQHTSGTSYKWNLQVVSFQQSSDVHKKCKIQASTIYPNAIYRGPDTGVPNGVELINTGRRHY